MNNQQDLGVPDIHRKLLIHNSIESLKYDNKSIQDFKIIDGDGNTNVFSEYLSAKPVLVLKYSSYNCVSCVDVELENLMRFAESKGIDRVIVIAESSNFRELKAMLKTRHMDQIKALLILNDEFSRFYSISPMLFLINNELKITYPFIPIKEVPEYSDKYYKLIDSII